MGRKESGDGLGFGASAALRRKMVEGVATASRVYLGAPEGAGEGAAARDRSMSDFVICAIDQAGSGVVAVGEDDCSVRLLG